MGNDIRANMNKQCYDVPKLLPAASCQELADRNREQTATVDNRNRTVYTGIAYWKIFEVSIFVCVLCMCTLYSENNIQVFGTHWSSCVTQVVYPGRHIRRLLPGKNTMIATMQNDNAWTVNKNKTIERH